ncbi:hypothetical protein FDB52_06990 [Clostridium botulinum]|nr:hypothetical protein [Clostridium botulinum]NFN48294.1 hypothetical protein [Clostridium botulinum]
MSEGKIIESYNQGLTQVMSVIKELTNEIKGLNSQVEKLSKDNKALGDRVQSLEKQTKKNSNKPPSTDDFKKKTKTLRTKSGKKPGGQEGHDGKTLELSENPDEIIDFAVYFKGLTEGGIANKIYTIPIYLLPRFNFEELKN